MTPQSNRHQQQQPQHRSCTAHPARLWRKRQRQQQHLWQINVYPDHQMTQQSSRHQQKQLKHRRGCTAHPAWFCRKRKSQQQQQQQQRRLCQINPYHPNTGADCQMTQQSNRHNSSRCNTGAAQHIQHGFGGSGRDSSSTYGRSTCIRITR